MLEFSVPLLLGMASVLQYIEVVGRLLSTLNGTALEQATEVQIRALSANIAKVKVLTTEEKQQLSTAIAGLCLDEASKNSLLVLVHGKGESRSRKRPLQDFVSWPNFGTHSLWRDIGARPDLTLELVCQLLNSIGLINPTKDTQKSIAAHVVTAEFAQNPLQFPPTDATASFKSVGKRLKQLYKAEPIEYITKFPASPAEMLRQHPTTARAVYCRSNLPCACPLDPVRVAQAESMIKCRGEKSDSSDSSGHTEPHAMMHQMMAFMMQGFRRMHQPHASQEPALQLFPPGSLSESFSPTASQGATRFRQLGAALGENMTPPSKRPEPGSGVRKLEGAFGEVTPPSKRPIGVGSPNSGVIVDAAPAGPAEAPMCLALLDRTAGKATEEVPAPDGKIEAVGMRSKIVASRAKLLADRIEAAAKSKAAKLCKGKGKAKGKAKSKGKAKPKACAKKPCARNRKPASWLKAKPNGCGKCRYVPGCTKSCYLKRGEKVPK